MHLRRALLLFAIVLGVSALIAAITPRERGDERGESQPTTTAPPPPAPPAREENIRLDARRKPREVRVKPRTHAIVKVVVPRAGDVEIKRLGLIEAAGADAPATFDLLLERSQRLDVVFTAVGERPRRAGSIIVEG